ncbi:MAG TPA: hypothetical protein VFE72_10655 [Lysobacter sp.]|nr:hypothetical protein [Lysobacter sp.]
MIPRLRPVIATFRLAALAGLAGLVLLAAAITLASARYDGCGPSALDAVEPACRRGLQLLMAAYGVLSVALVFGATSLTLLWRDRRRRRG